MDPTDRDRGRDPKLEDEAVDYVLGELSADARRDLERALAADPARAAELRRLHGVLGLLPYATAEDPPAGLRARVLAAAEAQARAAARVGAPATVHDLDAARARRAGRRIPWSRVAAAAAAVLALALGIDDYRTRRDVALERQLTAALQEPNVVQRFALAGAGGAYGTVALDLDAKKGAVVLRGMAPLPAGRVYRLWARVLDAAVPCGDFHPSPDGAVVAQFAVPVESYKGPVGQLFVTVEARGAPPTPTGPAVLASS